MKVLIVVTHLLGTGHLSRALTLARAFVAAGHRARVVSGGMPAPQLVSDGIELEQLPPLRSDGTDFSRLLDAEGAVAGPDLLAARRDALAATVRAFQPDILITELFPFGRRILTDEFLALLESAAALTKPPLVLSSVRDILAPPSKPARAERAAEILANLYDGVLVHSDAATMPLEASWPVSETVRPLLRYTGYVAPAPAKPHPEGTGTGEIVVSAGGGAVGETLFRAAARAAVEQPDQTWRILVGGADPGALVAELRALVQGTASIVEPARSDFRQLLPRAAASVSMCGYNTAIDLLMAGTPAVLVPFDAGNEVEQGLRAHSLARLPGFSVLASADLSPDTLLRAVELVRQAPRRPVDLGQFDGAARSVAIAVDMAEGRQ